MVSTHMIHPVAGRQKMGRLLMMPKALGPQGPLKPPPPARALRPAFFAECEIVVPYGQRLGRRMTSHLAA